MPQRKLARTRREFIGDAALLGAAAWAGGLTARRTRAGAQLSRLFEVTNCPTHDGQLRHIGLDVMLTLLAEHGLPLYRTQRAHPWGGASGLVDRNDVVVVKVNCQWKCRGTTNTDVVRGLVHRILDHPDGFLGEVVLIENGQGRGSFSGVNPGETSNYRGYPEVLGKVVVNSEDELLTIDRLVNDVFAGRPVSAYLLDPIRSTFLTLDDHTRDGYRTVSPPPGTTPATAVSYPCFTTAYGTRIELREGVWTGREYADTLKLINVPVLKHHGGSGMTGALKHVYGILSMSDGGTNPRHYAEIGSQCGKMWKLVRTPDLNILDCIWVSQGSLTGYPISTTTRCDTLLAGLDPVAMDYVAAKRILLPLGGRYAGEHDPDAFSGLVAMLADACATINASGGIGGAPCQLGDENIELIGRAASARRRPRRRLGSGTAALP
jgi:hypothetical protein